MAKTKLVTVESSGIIPILGGLMGPISSPCRIEVDILISLINSGKIVYEVNPKNIKEKIRLTRMNVLNDNFINKPIVKKDTEGFIPYDRFVESHQTINNPSNIGLTIKIIHNTKDTDNVSWDSDSTIGTDLFISNKKSK